MAFRIADLNVMVFFTVLFCFWVVWPTIALGDSTSEQSSETEQEQSESDKELDGAAASDPTAAVNFQDFRFRWLDLGNSKERQWCNTEGGYMLTPNIKLINELHYFRTDLTGDWESSLESFHLKGIYLFKPFKIGVIGVRPALGSEWILDLGDFEDGTGTGANLIAPLGGLGWNLNPKDFLITLVQHFHSYSEESGAPEISITGPRVIYLRKIPAIQGWLKLDYKMTINHEDDEEVNNTIELQLGRMFSPRIGLFIDGLYAIDDPEPYDWGVGIGMRFMYR